MYCDYCQKETEHDCKDDIWVCRNCATDELSQPSQSQDPTASDEEFIDDNNNE